MKYVKLLVRNPVNYPDYVDVVNSTTGGIRRVDGGFIFPLSRPTEQAKYSFVPDSNVRECLVASDGVPMKVQTVELTEERPAEERSRPMKRRKK